MPLAMVFATLFATVQLARAGTPIWNNASGGNWSVGSNWSTLTEPGTADDVQFGDTGAGSQNTLDIAGETIDSLTYDQDNQAQQTTVINPGANLTINSSVAAGTALLSVGSTSGATTSSTLVPVAIQGATNTLTLNGLGDMVVGQGNSTAGSHLATLDLSGLGRLNATIGRLLVGVGNSGTVNRSSGDLILAQTNKIVLTGASPQVEVQESPVNANGGTVSTLSFGQQNQLFADTMRFGGDKGNGTVNFEGSVSSPSLQMRNADGVSPCSTIDFGYNDFASSGNSTVNVTDFSAGTVDVLVNLVHIAQGNPGTGTGGCTATVTLAAGTFNVGDLEIGYGNATAANSGGTAGTLNVDNNNLYSTGAVVSVSTVITLARTNGPTSVINGTLTIGNDGNPGGVVRANTIVSGGGVSTINLVAGTLQVTNTIGSLAYPIRNFLFGVASTATLDIPLSGSGSAMIVSNLMTGSVNLINITAVPGIASYPATFTLIQYQGTEGGSGPGTFTLNSLPAASPSYAGTIVDTGNGVVQVVLASGPTAVLATTWTGSTDTNWNYTTPNWLYQGSAADFVDGRATLFTDSTTKTNLALDAALSPSSITVSNNVVPYTFGGTGKIAGSATLTKDGSSSLTLDNSGGNNNINTVVINGGQLQLGNGDAASGGLSSVNITNDAVLVVDRTDAVTLSSAISGTGTLSQIGSGTLIVSGANSYNGATTVTNGTLELDETSAGTSPVTTTAGTILSGGGVAGGLVTVGGEFSPGSPTVPGTFQAENGLTLSAGSTLNFGLNASDTSTSDGANDLAAVTGNLTAHNNTVTVNFAGTPQNGSQYTLFTYSGTLSGSFNPVVNGTHFPVTLDTVSQSGNVLLDVTGSSGYALDWSSTASSAWDMTTSNWLNLATSTHSSFLAGDTVQFDDTPGVQTAITISNGTLYPSMVTVISTNNNFNISGAGGIGGSASLVKAGPSTLTLGTANSFTGTIDIQGGILQTASGSALGNAASTTVESGATLDLDGQNIGGAIITASGPGANGVGAIINNGAAISPQAVREIVLTGDTTLGGSGNWEINNSGGAASISTGGNPYNLTKVGGNVVDIQNLATFDTALANIDIQAGTLLFDGLTPDMGDPSYTLTVETGAQLAFGANSITWNKQFVFNGNGTSINLNNETAANDVIAGPITLNGNCVFNIGGTQLGISSTIGGTGGLIKSGTSPLILSGSIAYTGETLIDAGTLELTNDVTLATSTNITIATGATLDMQGTALSLVSGQSLNGSGTVINSTLTAGTGSTVAPGVGGVGVLTIDGAITLAGNTTVDLSPATATNGVLASTGGITYGGTLNLVNLSASPLPNNSSYKIFQGTNYSGSFSSIVPATPGPNQAWNTSALATTGTIKVVSVAPLAFGHIALVGGNVVLSGANGPASGQYYVLTSTNLTLPEASWTRIATNSFDVNGNFSFTNSLTPPAPQRFFQIQLP
jgi:fibronectin-binding autotransporter adhesin